MKVLLFGGTFDPVHNGHVAMLRAAQVQLKPDEARIIPVGNPWQKGRLPFASAVHRSAMLKLAFSDVLLDERELKREGPTYTVDTLKALHQERSNCEFNWLIGSDSFAKLDTWHEPNTLASLATFAVVRRANEVLAMPKVACRYVEVLVAPPPVSSTQIRALLAAGVQARDDLYDLAPQSVCDYIVSHQLYQTTAQNA
jgi:nicotinate-nucleotide adenylyltransferase